MIAWLALLLLLGFCMRWPQLSASFYGDEVFSLFRDSNQLLTTTEDRFRPLFFSLLYLWKQLGFHGEVGLRLLPLIFGLLQIPVAFQLGRILVGFRGAMVFALLVAVNPLLIEFSQELRMYSLVPFIALLQALAYAKLCQRALRRRRLLPSWIGFIVAGVAGVYTHFHYWFLIAGFAFALLRQCDLLPIRQSIIALSVPGLFYLSNIPNLLYFQSEAANASHLTVVDLSGALPKLLAAFVLGFNYFSLPSLGLERALDVAILKTNIGLALVAVVPALIVCWRLIRLHSRRPIGTLLWMAHELFTVPCLLSFLAAVVMGRNFIHPKYMVFCAPFMLLFLTAAFLAMRHRVERWLATVSVACVFAIAFVHFNQPTRYGRREDYRGVAELLRAAATENCVVLWLGERTVHEPMRPSARPSSIWEYYGADLLPYARVVGLPRRDATVGDLRSSLDRIMVGQREVYYVWHEITRNRVDPRDIVLAGLRERLGVGERTQLNPRWVVYHWTLDGV